MNMMEIWFWVLIYQVNNQSSDKLYTANQSVKCWNECGAECMRVCNWASLCVCKSCAAPEFLITVSAESP